MTERRTDPTGLGPRPAPRDNPARARADEAATSREGRLLVELADLRQELEAAKAQPPAAGALPPSDPPASDPSDPFRSKAVRKASWRILALLSPLVGSGLLAAGKAALELWHDVQALKGETAELRDENRALRAELAAAHAKQAQSDDYNAKLLPWVLGVLEKQGVRARRPDGVEPTEVDVTIPLRRPGEIKRGPVLEVLDAPPKPP